ncbi:hypothetical protein C8F01DRAFT_1152404 [Mycena amicta]|nr:hypothetical protein C8F01DRAFT_1152404 [Mycena amicta]
MERRNQSVSSLHSPTVATESFACTPAPPDSGPRHNTGPPANAQASNCAMALESYWNAPVNGQPQEELVKVILLPMLAQQEASTVKFPVRQPWKPEVSVPDSNPESGGEVHPDGMGIDADAEDVALVLAEADVDSETEADAMMGEDLRSCF